MCRQDALQINHAGCRACARTPAQGEGAQKKKNGETQSKVTHHPGPGPASTKSVSPTPAPWLTRGPAQPTVGVKPQDTVTEHVALM